MPLPWNSENLTKVVIALMEKAVDDVDLRRKLIDDRQAGELIAAEFDPRTLPHDWASRHYIFDTLADPERIFADLFPPPSASAEAAVTFNADATSLRFDMSNLGVGGKRAAPRPCRPSGTRSHAFDWHD